MRITIKLYASLAAHLPDHARSTNQHQVELANGTTVGQALAPYGLPPALTKLVLVNGHYIEEDNRGSHLLKDGDVLAVWPPAGGN
jgi:sulfur carrier protein ThiS